MITKEQALNLIRQTVVETIGCTEPVAIAIAASTAYQQIDGDIISIDVTLDKNVYKNAYSVTIPGTDKKGIKNAIALAIANTDPSKGLMLFEDLTKDDIKKADKINLNLIEIHHKAKAASIYIEVQIYTTNGSASCLIENSHDNITLITKNDEVICENNCIITKKQAATIKSFTVTELKDILKKIPEEELSFLKRYIDVNLSAVEQGLQQDPKKNIGTALKNILKTDSFFDKIKYSAAAAASLRMGGEKVHIIGCGGSGNHGITFFIAIGLTHQYLEEEKGSLTKALAFGLLILLSIKQATGLLTPMCGCSVAAAAAAAGAITYFLNGTDKEILSSINLVLGTLAGMIYDGAKLSCSLKISSSVSVAIESALLAKNGLSICGEGITDNCLISTIDNLASLHSDGMKKMDEAILNVFSRKKPCTSDCS